MIEGWGGRRLRVLQEQLGLHRLLRAEEHATEWLGSDVRCDFLFLSSGSRL